MGSFPLTVTATTMGYRSYENPLKKAPLRTVTGRGNDPRYTMHFKKLKPCLSLGPFFKTSGQKHLDPLSRHLNRKPCTTLGSRFPSNPLIRRVTFFLVFSFSKETTQKKETWYYWGPGVLRGLRLRLSGKNCSQGRGNR